jgi:hypothetical protein
MQTRKNMEQSMEDRTTLETQNRLNSRATEKLAREQLSRSAAELRQSRFVANPSAEDLAKRSHNARALGLVGGALGGVSKSEAKRAAARRNGALSKGAPRKNPVVDPIE